MPADWFTSETWSLLTAYCQHTAAAADIMAVLRDNPVKAELDYKKLKAIVLMRKMLVTEHRMMVILASKLRITPMGRSEVGKQISAAEHEKAGVASIRPTFQVDDAAA
jgi:hypothetical protein